MGNIDKEEADCLITSRVSRSEKEEIVRNAKKYGITISQYVRDKVVSNIEYHSDNEVADDFSNRFFTTAQVSKILYISQSMVKKLCHTGKLSYIKANGRLLFSPKDIEEYEKNYKIKATITPPSEDLLSVEEVRIQLSVTHGTILRWIKTGKISASKIGRDYRIQRSELIRLLEKQKSEQI